MDEKTDSSGGGDASKLGSSSVLPLEKGSKNKRKLEDPSVENPVDVPLPMNALPLYGLPPEIIQGPTLGKSQAGSSRESVEEDFGLADWDNPIASQLEELLVSTLQTIFRNAIRRIVEYGYKEDIAEKAISRRGLYLGGTDLVSNVVNDALASLKKGEEGDISSTAFNDLPQLVEYTMLEMIGVLREVKPSLSIAEAMWWLLMCDLNISVACEMEEDMLHNFGCKDVSGENSDCNSQLKSETQNCETVLPRSDGPDAVKPSLPCSENCLPEALKFGNFPNSPYPKNPLADEWLSPEIESWVSMGASGDYFPVASVSEEKSGTGRKGRCKKDLAMLRQKSFSVEKYRGYGYGKGALRAAKIASIGGFVVEKRMKSPSSLPAVHVKCTSKIHIGAGPLANESHNVLTNSSSGLTVTANSSKMTMKVTKSAVRTTAIELAPQSSSLDKKPVPKSEGKTSVSSKTPDQDTEKISASKAEGSTSMASKTPDYYAGIPYDESLGKYIPQDKEDELILKLVPRLQELQNELHSWTEWTNQKVMQAARRLSKDQAELKSLRQEREEVELLKKEKQLLEENTMKRLSEMEFALNNATTQVEDAKSTVQKLEVEHSLLKKEMEVAKLKASESAASCREALEREQKALKDIQAWDGQRSVLQGELASEKQEMTELQKKVGKAKNNYNQTEMRWKQERMAKEKFIALAASVRKERECLEAAVKVDEAKIKQKAEKDVQKHGEEIKELENKLLELKMKVESSKIAALRRGSNGGNGQCSSVNKGDQVQSFWKKMVDIKDYSGGRGLKQERECVMCLSEEKVVVFRPCAHQVLCIKCNELHKKQGMKDCPACRTLIDLRICARFAKP